MLGFRISLFELPTEDRMTATYTCINLKRHQHKMEYEYFIHSLSPKTEISQVLCFSVDCLKVTK